MYVEEKCRGIRTLDFFWWGEFVRTLTKKMEMARECLVQRHAMIEGMHDAQAMRRFKYDEARQSVD